MQGMNNYYKMALIINVVVLTYFGYREYTRVECTKIINATPIISQTDVVNEGGGGEKTRPLLGFLSYRPDQRRRLEALVQRKVGGCFRRRSKNEFIEMNKNEKRL